MTARIAFSRRLFSRRLFSASAFAAVALLATACTHMRADSNLVTLTTQLRGANEVPPVMSMGSGQVDAVLNTDTNLLRWKLSYSGLSGPATAGHFHGPAAVGANGGVVLPFPGTVRSPMEGSATLTAAQVSDLLASRWYANIHTANNPGR